MSFDRVAVVGAGTMGNGIAQVFATSGRKVELIDVNGPALERAVATIGKSLGKLEVKGKVPPGTKDQALGQITTHQDLKAAKGCALAVEAVVESLDTKRSIFAQLAETCGEGAVLASNTSSISITELAHGVARPERVIGMHFMNPVPLMELVEVVRGVRTSDECVATIEQLSRDLGKTPVTVNDYPGFISNRVLMPMINEAIYCLMEGVADAKAIDTIMKLGMAHPMGPLTLADLIGLDV
ncbi:MAG: 3-hydroxybutyryl-CoA dehydrogenase, partial [Phycisphaerales bacterium]|nr:3-hydroxybutyryl-CoA dehydrogenase [Phycisphaerales bacterium]